MSAWPGKYVIGLTGNIATGKSVIRKMLEHLGAFGIDADGLTHRAMAPAGPAFQPIVDTFGKYIVAADGQIDRARLAGIVFNDPAALAQLEAIVHPFVHQAIDLLARRTRKPVVVVEAIKLLEGSLADQCDVVWVVDAPDAVQQERLQKKRKLDADEAALRVQSQNPQTDKLARADFVITNAGSFEDTWAQVQRGWSELPAPRVVEESAAPVVSADGLKVRRGLASDAEAIAEFVNTVSGRDEPMTRADVIASFGQKAYFMALDADDLQAVIGWQVENLVTRVDELHLAQGAASAAVIDAVMKEVEAASAELQSEAAFLFVTPDVAKTAAGALEALGYEQVDPDRISVSAWRDAAGESQPPDTVALFKRLREDRVLRPV